MTSQRTSNVVEVTKHLYACLRGLQARLIPPPPPSPPPLGPPRPPPTPPPTWKHADPTERGTVEKMCLKAGRICGTL